MTSVENTEREARSEESDRKILTETFGIDVSRFSPIKRPVIFPRKREKSRLEKLKLIRKSHASDVSVHAK